MIAHYQSYLKLWNKLKSNILSTNSNFTKKNKGFMQNLKDGASVKKMPSKLKPL